ncbi:MAG: stage II sporulation protein M [Bacteroidia bacterium]
MKESEFVDQNKEKWVEFENKIQQKSTDPDALSDVFIQVTDDLSYVRSHYTNRSVRVYMNELAGKVFNLLGKRQKFDIALLKEFYTVEVPQLFYLARKHMRISLVTFLISMLIGMYNSHQNPEFAALILGEDYVAMTQQNIEKGEAMDVYTGGTGWEGFLMILLNNARIDILMLGLGLFFGVGALWVLIYNGIMVGVFQYFFWQHGGFKDSILTIWLHGTIEITTIILTGGVALLAGLGLLFPKNYTRYQSFRLGAGNAGKLLLVILPFTVIAALIEGFVTRMTGMPDVFKAFFIFSNLAFVIFYFVWYPSYINKKIGANPLHEKLRKEHKAKPILENEVKTVGQIINEAFIRYQQNFGRIITACILLSLAFPFLVYYRFHDFFTEPVAVSFEEFTRFFGSYRRNFEPFNSDFVLAKTLYFGVAFFILLLVLAGKNFNKRQPFIMFVLLVFSLLVGYDYFAKPITMPLNILTSFLRVWIIGLMAAIILQSKKGIKFIRLTFTKFFSISLYWLGLGFIIFFAQMLIHSALVYFIIDILPNVLPFSGIINAEIVTAAQISVNMMIMLAILPLYYYSLELHWGSMAEKQYATALKNDLLMHKTA